MYVCQKDGSYINTVPYLHCTETTLSSYSAKTGSAFIYHSCVHANDVMSRIS